MRIQYIFILFALAACRKPPLSHFGDKDISGQTPTSDMVFVAGKGKVPSFYVGVSEEPNVNYVAYLNWLRRVYLDYPQVAKDAEIKVKTLGEVHRFNDPLLTYHMEHPAFAYYPIVGATWYQANKYLQWKTDRVNEDILIRNKVLMQDYDQANEANFNTEAYVYGQHDGLMQGKKQLRDQTSRNGTRIVAWQDGILLPQYRLPTEAEWELLKNENTRNDVHSQYPYGKNYPILRWVRTYFRGSGIYNNEPHAMSDYDYHWKKGVIPNPLNYENYAQGIQGPYLSKKNKLPSNVAGNVREWLLDIYEDEPQTNWESFAEYFWQNEFETRADSMQFVYDKDGVIDLKDSLGKLPFKIYGTNSDGSAFWVVPPIENGSYRRFVGMKYKDVPLDKYDSWNTDNFELIYEKTKVRVRRAFYETYYPMVNYQGQIMASQKPFLRIQELNNVQQFIFHGQNRLLTVPNWNNQDMDSIDKRAKIWIKEEWDKEQKQGLSYYRLGDGLFVYYNEILGDYTKQFVADYKIINRYSKKPRLVRGGTWQSPDFNRREPMSPDSAAMDVGFRCVMPYISTPVKKEYKVKW